MIQHANFDISHCFCCIILLPLGDTSFISGHLFVAARASADEALRASGCGGVENSWRLSQVDH